MPAPRSLSEQAIPFGAFNRNRTDDLILTMDALYRLSYKGVRYGGGAGDGNRTHAVSLGS